MSRLNGSTERPGRAAFVVTSVLPTQQQRADDCNHNLKFLSVQFDGILQVIEPKRFRKTLVEGIGSGKAYGFGLLSIAPARSRPNHMVPAP